MNRRKLLGAIAALVPSVGDGVALTSTSHPEGPASGDGELNESSLNDLEIELHVYAREGETVTCENGHPICEFAETVCTGQTQDLPRQLRNWTQPAPKVGQLKQPLCQTCGAKFYLNGGIFHIDDGWRDPTGMIERFGILS